MVEKSAPGLSALLAADYGPRGYKLEGRDATYATKEHNSCGEFRARSRFATGQPDMDAWGL